MFGVLKWFCEKSIIWMSFLRKVVVYNLFSMESFGLWFEISCFPVLSASTKNTPLQNVQVAFHKCVSSEFSLRLFSHHYFNCTYSAVTLGDLSNIAVRSIMAGIIEQKHLENWFWQTFLGHFTKDCFDVNANVNQLSVSIWTFSKRETNFYYFYAVSFHSFHLRYSSFIFSP